MSEPAGRSPAFTLRNREVSATIIRAGGNHFEGLEPAEATDAAFVPAEVSAVL